MRVQLSNDNHWTISDDTMVCGNAFLDGTHLSEEELADKISGIDSESELKSTLSRTNGFFSVIHGIEDRTYAAVDHVRSWPLYYATTDDIYISDSAEWVHDAGSRNGYDPKAGNEYLFTCYVTGKDTISKDVKQVRAGELLVFYNSGPKKSPEEKQYYEYDTNRRVRRREIDDFDDVLVNSFERLIEYADGRTILVGLSSGYDSRLMALMLSRLGYEDTVTYTTLTASENPKEAEIAESIANDLQFEHIKVATEHSDYRYLDNSDQLSMINNIGYLSEYPHINKFVLQQKLENEGINPNEVVHILGHQLISVGEFLPDRISDESTVSRSEFLSIMWNHYSNWIEQGNSQLRELFEGQMLDRIPTDLYRTGTVEPTPEAMNGFEQWYWQERLPKFILARREYEHLGFDMWYPLLDRAVCSFYEQSSYRDKVGRRLLEKYVDNLDTRVRGETDSHEPGGSPPSVRDLAWKKAVQAIHKLPEPVFQYIRQSYIEHVHTAEKYHSDPRYGIVTETEFDAISSQLINYRTLLLLYLYDRGYFNFPLTTEFDIALEE